MKKKVYVSPSFDRVAIDGNICLAMASDEPEHSSLEDLFGDGGNKGLDANSFSSDDSAF